MICRFIISLFLAITMFLLAGSLLNAFIESEINKLFDDEERG